VAAFACSRAVYGQATLTPPTHDFSNVVIGQSSSAVTFTFMNNSSASDTITSVSSSDPQFEQPPGTVCNPIIVPAHDSCILTITFTPSANGLQSSTLTVNSTDAINPVVTASLTGNGVAAVTSATLSPPLQTFPSTSVGSSSIAEPFTLTNTGNTAIGNITSNASGDYSATPICGTPAALAVGASCTIDVVFRPSASGTRTGTLTVNFSNNSGPALTSSLTGTGIPPVTGLTLSTNALSMGSYQVGAGASPAMAVTLTNNDPSTVTFTAAVGANGLTFPVSGDFAQTNNCPHTLAAYASCSASITFTPMATGIRNGLMTVQSTASNGTQTLGLSGNGTDYTMTAATPSVTVPQGSTAVYRISLSPVSGYTGSINLYCTGLHAVGTSCTGNNTVTLGPVSTVNFSVTTTPKNYGGVIANGVAPSISTTTAAGRMGWILTGASLLLLALAGRIRRLAKAAGLLALLLALLWPTGGCSGKQPTPDPDATMPGTYSFILTGIDAAGDTKSLPLTLVVTAQ